MYSDCQKMWFQLELEWRWTMNFQRKCINEDQRWCLRQKDSWYCLLLIMSTLTSSLNLLLCCFMFVDVYSYFFVSFLPFCVFWYEAVATTCFQSVPRSLDFLKMWKRCVAIPSRSTLSQSQPSWSPSRSTPWWITSSKALSGLPSTQQIHP